MLLECLSPHVSAGLGPDGFQRFEHADQHRH
jgi:hypothetical protein